jgi:cell shape-determining protein MreD
MVQIAMLVSGIATGLACRSWRQAWVIILALFAVTVAVQTPLVAADNHLETSADFVSYTVIQAVSLAIALFIARACIRRRERRAGGVTSVAAN